MGSFSFYHKALDTTLRNLLIEKGFKNLPIGFLNEVFIEEIVDSNRFKIYYRGEYITTFWYKTTSDIGLSINLEIREEI